MPTATHDATATGRRRRRRGGYHHNPGGDDDHAVVQVVYQIVQEPRLVPRSSATPATLTGPDAPRVHTFRVPATASEREPDAFGRAEDAHASTLVAPHDVRVPNPAFLLPPISSSDDSGDGSGDEAALLDRGGGGGGGVPAVASTVVVSGNPFRVPVPRPTVVRDAWIAAPAFGTFTSLVMAVALMITLAMIDMPIYHSVAADGTAALVFPWRVEYCPRPADLSVLPCEAWGLGEAATAAKYITESCADRVETIAVCIVLLNIATVAAVALGLLEALRKEPFPYAAMAPTALCIALSGCVWGLADKAIERQECRLGTGTGYDLAIAVFALSWAPVCITWLRLLRPGCCMAGAEYEFELSREADRARQVITERDGRRDNRTDPDAAGTLLEQMPVTWFERLVPACILLLVCAAAIVLAVACDQYVAGRFDRSNGSSFLQLFNRLHTCHYARLGDDCETTQASNVLGSVCMAHLNAASALVVIALAAVLAAATAVVLELCGRRRLRSISVALCIFASVVCFVAYALVRAALERGYCFPFGASDHAVPGLVLSAGVLLACVVVVAYSMLFRHATASSMGVSQYTNVSQYVGLSYHDQLRLERADRINAAEAAETAAAAAAYDAADDAAANLPAAAAPANGDDVEPVNDDHGAALPVPKDEVEMQPLPGQPPASPPASSANPIADPDASSSMTADPQPPGAAGEGGHAAPTKPAAA